MYDHVIIDMDLKGNIEFCRAPEDKPLLYWCTKPGEAMSEVRKGTVAFYFAEELAVYRRMY